MKNHSHALTICVATICFALGAYEPCRSDEPLKPHVVPNPSEKALRADVTLGRKTVRTTVANTEKTLTEGLLGWNTITDDEGMLLEFPVVGQYAIHMQGMKFPIDAVWIDSAGTVRLIYHQITANSGQVYPSMVPCRYCLELNAGFCKRFDVKEGQSVIFGGTRK